MKRGIYMWETILLSFGPSVLEALGTKFADFREKEKLNNKLCGLIKEKFKEFENTSLNCDEFESVIKEENFIEILRNYFFIVNDGVGRQQYIEFVVNYLHNQCPKVEVEDICSFFAAIEVFYIDYLHNIIESSPAISACYQLMTISNREIISKIRNNQEEFMGYLYSLQNRKKQFDEDNINIYHNVCHKEFGVIRFTGIDGAERKKPQNINEFYVENTFSYYGKEIDRLYLYRTEEMKSICLENFFDLGNKIVLIGGAGLGKSTTLNYLFCNYEKLYNSYAFKLKIDLKEYAKEIGDKKKSLLWCISNEFIKRIPHGEMSIEEIQLVISQKLKEGRCLVILDALDEIPSQPMRTKVRDEIANFTTIYYLNKFIISTREAGYLRNRFDNSFLHIRINKFEKEQIKKYSKNWYITTYDESNDFEVFWTKFELEVERARCENMIRNPIMLVLALVVFDVQKNLPTKRIEFYQKCVNTFLTERENRKGAIELDDKTKSILASNLIIPKIAHYKFQKIEENSDYIFNNNELKNSVLEAIDILDYINWQYAISEYSTYLVERTEIIQEVDEEKLDFAHKTFYEYFLAFYFSKMYDVKDLVDLLKIWIGDSNYDELARLIVEVVIQNNEPKQHNAIIDSLFTLLNTPVKHNILFSDKIDIFDLFVDLFNHNLLQPKFHKMYHEFILNNSIYVHFINNKFAIKNGLQKVKYDSLFLSNLFIDSFKKGNLINIIDCIKYLNNEFRKQVVLNDETGVVYRLCKLFPLDIYMNEKITPEKSINDIKYFLNEGLEYTLTCPQIFIAVINRMILANNETDIEKLLDYKFMPCNVFMYNISRKNLKLFIERAMESKTMFLLFFISISDCMHKDTNSFFDMIFSRLFKKSQNDTVLTNFICMLWDALNNSTFDEFITKITNMDLYDYRYFELYKKLFNKYIDECKGKWDDRIKKYIENNFA